MNDENKLTPGQFNLIIDNWLGKTHPTQAKKKIEPELDNCYHNWSRYTGLNKVEDYCLLCNKTRPVEKSVEDTPWNHDDDGSF